MLHRTFQHIQGIGEATERRLWQAGVRRWADWPPGGGLRLRVSGRVMDGCLRRSHQALQARDAAYFARRLPARLHWRLFPAFRDDTAFVDIETDGLDMERGAITTIALYDGRSVRTYVRGANLEDFARDIGRYRLLVTYNGKCFDVPFIERHLGIRPPEAHIDLRYPLAALGYKGGLKGCERALGIDRGVLDGVDGFFAVMLWQDYRYNANQRALETLLAYNVHDTVNLEALLVAVYNRLLEATPFAGESRLEPPLPPAIPYRPDAATVVHLKQALGQRRTFPGTEGPVRWRW